MIALWIILAIVVVAALAVTVTAGVRRRRSHPGPQATVEAPPRGPPAPPARPSAAPAQPRAPPRPRAAPPGPAAPPSAPAAPEKGVAEPTVEEAVEVEEGVELEEPVAAPAPPRFRDRLGKTRGLLAGYLGSIRGRAAIDESTWEELEEALIRADVGVATTTAMLTDLQDRVSAKSIRDSDGVLQALREDLLEALIRAPVPPPGDAAAPRNGATAGEGGGADGPGGADGAFDRTLHFDGDPGSTNVWLFVGVNGVGKTTTVGKLARLERRNGRSVLLAAGDTFRAAAGEQLAQWAERADSEIVRGAEGGDPSAVVFDAVQRASARGNDLVLADTAGRLHTKVNLVEELKKIRRVADRPPGKVTEVLLVLDATTGQNALIQARQFTDAVNVTGVVLTKLDGTAKGGVVVAIQRELGVPVKLVGLGEGPDDLVPFDPEDFVDALLG
jgi:fused signal recognition particle receptor